MSSNNPTFRQHKPVASIKIYVYVKDKVVVQFHMWGAMDGEPQAPPFCEVVFVVFPQTNIDRWPCAEDK